MPTRERPRVGLGLLTAAVVGWALIAPLPLLASMADELWWRPSWQTTALIQLPSIGEALALAVMSGIVGLPLSVMFCFAAGMPAWAVAHWRGLKRRRHAAWVGAIVGMALVAVLALLKLATILFAGPASREPPTRIVFYYSGIALYIAGVGAVAGLAARWASGTRTLDRNEMGRVFG